MNSTYLDGNCPIWTIWDLRGLAGDRVVKAYRKEAGEPETEYCKILGHVMASTAPLAMERYRDMKRKFS